MSCPPVSHSNHKPTADPIAGGYSRGGCSAAVPAPGLGVLAGIHGTAAAPAQRLVPGAAVQRAAAAAAGPGCVAGGCAGGCHGARPGPPEPTRSRGGSLFRQHIGAGILCPAPVPRRHGSPACQAATAAKRSRSSASRRLQRCAWICSIGWVEPSLACCKHRQPASQHQQHGSARQVSHAAVGVVHNVSIREM